jgi:hypothetical protein
MEGSGVDMQIELESISTVDYGRAYLSPSMPRGLQQKGSNKMPLSTDLVQPRGPGHNKMPVKPVQKMPPTRSPRILPLLNDSEVRKIHAWARRDYDAVYDLDPLIDEIEADNAVAIFAHLPLKKDVEDHILTFVKRVDEN